MEQTEIKPVSTSQKGKQNKIGAKFEEQVSAKCLQYREEGRGYIFKVPTEITMIRKGARIVNAFPKDKSNVDFWGVLPSGRTFIMETKSCNEKTSFPLKNIKEHQFDFFVETEKYTILRFYLIEMRPLEKIFLVHADDVEYFRQTETRKSLPLTWLEEYGTLIEDLDFLSPIGF